MIHATPHLTGPVANGLWAVQDGPVNLYVLAAPEGLVCVDAGWRAARIVEGFARLRLVPGNVRAVLLTHRHWDHARGLRAFPGADVFTSASPRSLRVAGVHVDIVPCPGHTSDSTAFVVRGHHLFTGDTVWLRGGLACPGPRWLNRDGRALAASLRQLAAIDGLEAIHTAHTGSTTDVGRAFAAWKGGSA